MISARPTCQEGVDIIKVFEGFRSKPYKCVAGYWTIGYGQRITDAQVHQYAAGISRELATVWLIQALRKRERRVESMVKVGITDGQFGALVSFVYNLGSGSLKSSTLLRKLNRGDHRDAADEFGRWVYAGGKRYNGLVRRRAAERLLYLSDVQYTAPVAPLELKIAA